MNNVGQLLNTGGVVPLGLGIGLAVCVVVGFVLWLIGRSIAKPACVVSGLVFGGIAGLVFGTIWNLDGLMLLPLIVGCGIVGALLSGLLFRVWMGVSGAVILAVLAPICMFVWQGADVVIVPTPNDSAEPAKSQSSEVWILPGKNGQDSKTVAVDGNGDLTELLKKTVSTIKVQNVEMDQSADEGDIASASNELIKGATAKFFEAFNGLRDKASEQITSWWDARSDSEKMSIGIASAIGAIVGFLFGLIAPYWAASLESALAGGILMLLPGINLVKAYLPSYEGYVPGSPRAILVFLGLITVIGILIQWTIFRRSADK